MQFLSKFLSKFLCRIRVDDAKRDLERKVHKIEPTYKKIIRDSVRAEIICENTGDKTDCDRIKKLQGQVRKIRDQIAEVEEKIAELERKCG